MTVWLLFAFRKDAELAGMINTTGEIVVEPKYHSIYTKVGDIICVKETEKSKYSYIDIVCNRIVYNTDEARQEVPITVL